VRRRANSADGFLLCFLFNLLFNYWWGIIALILWILHLWLRIPFYWPIIGYVIWFGVALFSTWLVTWANSSSEEKTVERENLNPYSAKNSDIFGSRNAHIDSANTFQEVGQMPADDDQDEKANDCDT